MGGDMMQPGTMRTDFVNRLILVVDDDELTRLLLRDLCESMGFRVIQAADGQEAVERVGDSSPDLVLLDLMMPRRDGFSVLRWLREEQGRADLPVIILTAMGEMNGKIRGMELGADDYITKPFKLVELQTRINSALMVREYRRRLMAAEEELAQFRALDPVTGAGMYSQLKASLDSELARSRRYGRPVACLLFGFDDYQSLRYQLGRDACDAYLAAIVRDMKSCLRGADRLFRVDADEFVALLPETDLKGARIVAERLVESIRAVDLDAQPPAVVRCGGSVFPHEQIRTSEDLLREANRTYCDLKQKGDRHLFDA